MKRRKEIVDKMAKRLKNKETQKNGDRTDRRRKRKYGKELKVRGQESIRNSTTGGKRGDGEGDRRNYEERGEKDILRQEKLVIER